jgi:hypothetical protein
MRFFTPDLLDRFGSDEDQIASDAQQELERRSDEYSRHLHEIEPKLPERFRELLGRFYLHDARVIDHSHWERTHDASPVNTSAPQATPRSAPCDNGESRLLSFCVALQLDTPPRQVLVLQYRSVLIETTHHHTLLRPDACPYLEWQHDEVELIGTDRGTEFRHSVLFTSGLEPESRARPIQSDQSL